MCKEGYTRIAKAASVGMVHVNCLNMEAKTTARTVQMNERVGQRIPPMKYAITLTNVSNGINGGRERPFVSSRRCPKTM